MSKSVVKGAAASQAAVKRSSKRASKTATKPVPAVLAEPAKHQKTSKDDAKPKKNKLVRDSFTMPKSEYGMIAAVKKRCIAQGLAVKKSEVLRAAIFSLASQSDDYIKAAIGALTVIKTGRPSKGQS